MMTKNTMLLFLGVSMAMLSCKKESTDLQPIILHEPDADALKDFFHSNLADATQYFQIDASELSTIQGEQNVKVIFYPNTLIDSEGNDVTGIVDVELVEILSKKDMILKNKPTLCYHYGHHYGDYIPLISDGEFFLSVTQQNSPVFLKQYKDVKVILPRTGGIPFVNMDRFLGNNESDTLIWSWDRDSSAYFSLENASNWKTLVSTFGWINCDVFSDDPRPKTNVEAELPTGFDNNTCKVFISFDGIKSITQFYNYNEPVLSIAPHYELPIGQEVHFIAITVINDLLYCEFIPDILEENHRVQIDNLEMMTESEFEAALDALP